MPYKLKMTGLTEVQSLIEQVKKEIFEEIDDIKKKNIEFSLGPIDFSAEINEDQLVDLYKKLPKLINKAHKLAVAGLVDGLREALNSAMESPVWDWGSDTRDIIDTGALKNSLRIFADSEGDIHILYGESYAGIVHYGGYFNPYGNPNAKQYYPGRPWIDSVLKGGGPVPQFDFQAEYGLIFTRELKKLLV